jgi:hypothetical protein
VLAAVGAAREAGAARTNIVADGDDWPKQLYVRLGFDTIGSEAAFLKAPETSAPA